MANKIYLSVLNPKERKISKFIKKFSKFHSKKRHLGESEETHSIKVIEDRDGYFIIISSQHNEDGHMIKTMADVLTFLEENPDFQDIDIWGDKIEITGRFV